MASFSWALGRIGICGAIAFLPLQALALSLDEVRIGVLRHDIGSGLKRRYEKGPDINTEVLFPSFIDSFSLRPHLGASINTHGATSQFYTGLTWNWQFWQPFFVELSFGGELHTGRTGQRSSKKKALGSQGLFRESVSLGVLIAQHHTVSILLDHASNAHLAKPNPGLTALGFRYGYKF